MDTVQRNIEKFQVNDYATLAAFYKLARPDYPKTSKELRNEDERRDSKLEFARFIVRRDQSIIAVAEYTQLSYMYHPQKFVFEIDVQPKHRNQGLGSRLLAHLEQAVSQFDPLTFRTRSKVDRPAALHFLKKHGFVEEGRDWESRLDPNTLDYRRYDALFEHLNAEGIRIASLTELAKTDPNYKEKLYALECEADLDVPLPEPATHPDFEAWQKMFLEADNFDADAQLVALKDDEFIGMNALFPLEAEAGSAYNGFTGVKRSYRRKGIALALKVKNLEWAKKQGLSKVKTWNDIKNQGMLAINDQLGFQREPAWIYFKKEVGKL